MKSSTKILKTFWKISLFLAVTQAFEAGDFLNIFLRFWGVFKAHFFLSILIQFLFWFSNILTYCEWA